MSCNAEFLSLTAIAIASICSEVKCEQVKCHFPPSTESNHPRLVLLRPISEMKEFTFCSWIKPYAFGVANKSTILSYSSGANIDEMVLSIFSQYLHGTEIEMTAPELQINLICNQPLDFGFWVHICVLWFHDQLSLLINGEACALKNGTINYTNLRKAYIPGGGKLVIGQRQKLHGAFHTDQSWYGSMRDIHLWDEVLSVEEINDVREGHCRTGGNVFSWMKSSMIAFDGVQISGNDKCVS